MISNGPKFITIDEFNNYWSVNLNEMLRTSANPSNQAELFLARVENRLMSYIDNNTFRRYRYEDLQGKQLSAFKEAIILQAMYVYKNGDLGMDSGYDTERGMVAKRSDLVELSVCQDAIDILSNAGLWNLTMKNKPRTFGSGTGLGWLNGGSYTSSSGSVNVDLSPYLKKDGTVAMDADFNVGFHKVINVSYPIENSDATNKQYVDTHLSELESSISTINTKIPEEASATNLLADRNWVSDNSGKIDSISVESVQKAITNKNVNLTLSDFGIVLTDKSTPITIADKTFSTISTLFQGDSNGIALSLIQDYDLIVIRGYKENVSSPNKSTIILTKYDINSPTEWSIRLIANEWEYTLRLSSDGTNLYFYSTNDYSGSTVFRLTNIIGIKGV